MSCERYDETLIAVALGDARGDELERHLSVCSSCLTKLDEATQAAVDMDRDLRTLLSVTPAADFTARVTTRALNESRGQAWIRWGAATAACAALVLAAAIAPRILDRSGRTRDGQVGASTAPVAPPSRAEAPVEAAPQILEGARSAKPTLSMERVIHRRPVRGSRPVSASNPTREVIVESGQLLAVRRLVNAVAQGRLALVEAESPTNATEPAIAPVGVQPILIRDIEVVDATATPRASLQGGE